MDTMKAARLDVTHHTLNVEEVPVPTPGPGQAVIEVKAAGVCLSDVHLLEGLIAPQFLDSEKVTLGHEVAGVSPPSVTACRHCPASRWAAASCCRPATASRTAAS